MDREEFRKAGYAAVDRICDYFEQLANPDSQIDVVPKVQPGEIGALLEKSAPREGQPFQEIAKDFDRIILPGITHWQHPSFFAYFPANTTYESILADMYAGAVSNPGFNWLCSPACTELEVVVMDWVAQLLGLDPSFHNSSLTGGGVIMGSASESCLTVCVAARERAMRMFPDTKMENLVIVATTQTHSLGAKAALILGLGFEAIETKAEDDWGVRGNALKEKLDQLKSKGKTPFVFLATLGSTSTGAIDNIAEVTAVAADYPELFIHLDAAWGGVFLCLEEARAECQLEAINARSKAKNQAAGICASGEIHSFCTNLHKSGLVTFDASCLWIRDRKLLTEALDITPAYLRNKHSDLGTVVDYRNWQLPLGRKFRSLKLYFVLRSFGTSGFQTHLRKLNRLTQSLSDLFNQPNPEYRFKAFVARRFSLLVVRLTTETSTEEDPHEDDLNRAFFTRISERHEIFLTQTVVGGRYCIRIAVGSPLTQEIHIENAYKFMLEVAKQTIDARSSARLLN